MKEDLERLIEFAKQLKGDINEEDISYYYGLERAVNRRWCYERTIIFIYEEIRKRK